MDDHLVLTAVSTILFLLIYASTIIRILLRPNREPSSRVAWMVVILALPLLGIIVYLLLGETNIGRTRVEQMRKVIAAMPDVNHLAGADAADLHDDIRPNYVHLFQAGKTVNGFNPVEGNRGQLMADSKAAIDSIVADIDAAQQHGIKIPNLCHHPDLKPYGACRMCLVEDEKTTRLMAACVTPIAANMIIQTTTPQVVSHRRNIARLMIAEHPESCIVCNAKPASRRA